jgi:hypothetical protein
MFALLISASPLLAGCGGPGGYAPNPGLAPPPSHVAVNFDRPEWRRVIHQGRLTFVCAQSSCQPPSLIAVQPVVSMLDQEKYVRSNLTTQAFVAQAIADMAPKAKLKPVYAKKYTDSRVGGFDVMMAREDAFGADAQFFLMRTVFDGQRGVTIVVLASSQATAERRMAEFYPHVRIH